MEELLFKILDREVSDIDEISSIEMVFIMTEFNDFYSKDISIFKIIDCKSLSELYDLYQ